MAADLLDEPTTRRQHREFTDEEVALLEEMPYADELRRKQAADQREALGRQRIIGGLLTLAAMMAGQFADKHDAACYCGSCSPRKRFVFGDRDEDAANEAQHRNYVLAGAAFMATQAASAVEGVTPGEFKAAGRTWEDDLRALLAMEQAQPEPTAGSDDD